MALDLDNDPIYLQAVKENNKKSNDKWKKKNPTYLRDKRERLGRNYKQEYESDKEAILERNRIWREKNPEKIKAHMILNEAIIKGEIDRPDTCSICKEKKDVIGHHKDYSRPLVVKWVCRRCHSRKLHKN